MIKETENEPFIMEGVDCHAEDFTENTLNAREDIEENSEDENSHPCTDSDSKEEDRSNNETVIRIPQIPARPPRIKDNLPTVNKEYYNLCHTPPDAEVLPSLPRRKPVISSPDSPKAAKPNFTQPTSVQPKSLPPSLMTSSSVQPSQSRDNTNFDGFVPPNSSSTLVRQQYRQETSTTNHFSLGGYNMNNNIRAGSEMRSSTRCGSRSSAVSTLSTRTAHYRKKTLSRQRRKGSTCHCREQTEPLEKKKDELVLMYSRQCIGSTEWARYFHKVFSEISKLKGKLKVRHVPLEDLQRDIPKQIERELYNSRLQVVIISPQFLRWLAQHGEDVLVGRVLQQDRVIAILLGVTEPQVNSKHRASLISFPQWVHLEARDHDLEFVQTVLYFSSQILQRTELKESVKSETLYFSIFPRKVTESQNRVSLQLDKPIDMASDVRVFIERSGGARLLCEEVKIKNPYTLMVGVPVCLTAKSCLVNVYLEIDGDEKGFRQVKCEARQHEMEQLLATQLCPIEFLSHTIGISSQCKDQLDDQLTQAFLNNIPRFGLPLLTLPETEHNQTKDEVSEYPTLLHFSAGHGLEKLTCALLDSPGAQAALDIRNCHDLTAEALARQHGYLEIAEILKSYKSQPSKFSHIYDYIKHWHMNSPLRPPPAEQLNKQNGGFSKMASRCHMAQNPQPTYENKNWLQNGNNQLFQQQLTNNCCQNGVCTGGNSVAAPPPFCSPIKSADHHPKNGANSQNGGNINSHHGMASVASDFANSDYSGPDPPLPVYQVPPPPRPLCDQSSQTSGSPVKKKGNYLDMAGSNSPSPAQKKRLLHAQAQQRKETNMRNITTLLQSLEMHMEASTRQFLLNENSQQNTIDDPTNGRLEMDGHHAVGGHMAAGRPLRTVDDSELDTRMTREDDTTARISRFDRFGTMRASNLRRLAQHNKPEPEYTNFIPDNFPSSRRERDGSYPSTIQDDVFLETDTEEVSEGVAAPLGRVANPQGDLHGADYRGVQGCGDAQLAATDELLGLLEDFKHKSYTVKQMEILFENWRRKVEIPPFEMKQNKPKKSFLKMFKHKENESTKAKTNIQQTKNSKKFTKDGKGESESVAAILNESELNMVRLPPTPLKESNTVDNQGMDGVSSQILPLNRFSSDNSLPRSNSNSGSLPRDKSANTKTNSGDFTNATADDIVGSDQANHAATLPRATSNQTKESAKSSTLAPSQSMRQHCLPAYREPPSHAAAQKSKPVAEVSPFSSSKKNEKQLESVPLDSPIPPKNHISGNISLNSTSGNLARSSSFSNATKSTVSMASTVKRTSTPELGRSKSAMSHQVAAPNTFHFGRTTANLSPIREHLQKFRRSVTEPLFQYFHDLQLQSPDIEEPDVLNTPKTLQPPILDSSNDRRLSRQLFPVPENPPQLKENAGNINFNKNPRKIIGLREKTTLGSRDDWMRHPAKTSQINEYENISPTPSTDL